MKFWKLTLVAALVLVAVFALASCGCEHVYDEAITTRPTCTAEGEKTFTCSLCGDSYTEAIPKGDHAYIDTPTRPTCTEGGYITHTCKDCNYSYREELDPAKGHSYVDTVVVATCTTNGYTEHTCSVCNDTYRDNEVEKNPDAHTFETKIIELTAEQAAANPFAIGAEKTVCTGCGLESEVDTAVLVYLDFNDLPADVDSYEGSDAYKAAIAAGGDKITAETKQVLAYFDAQKNLNALDAWGKSGAITIDSETGKLVVGAAPFYVYDDLQLAYKTPVVSTFTISFDVVVNKNPATYTKKDRTPFFTMNDEKLYNNINVALSLDKVDVDTNTADEIYTYELYAQSYKDGPLKVDAATGYYITLGQEYSIQMEFTTVDGIYMYNLLIKAAGETEYTNVGSFEYQPYGQARKAVFGFSLSSSGNGNVFDNFKVTTDLVK